MDLRHRQEASYTEPYSALHLMFYSQLQFRFTPSVRINFDLPWR
jgi:hypothetical protein